MQHNLNTCQTITRKCSCFGKFKRFKFSCFPDMLLILSIFLPSRSPQSEMFVGGQGKNEQLKTDGKSYNFHIPSCGSSIQKRASVPFPCCSFFPFDSEVLKMRKLLFYSFQLFTDFNGLYIQGNVQSLLNWQGIQNKDVCIFEAKLWKIGFSMQLDEKMEILFYSIVGSKSSF